MNRNCYLCFGLIKFESLPAGDGILCECVGCGRYEVSESAKAFIDKNDLENETKRDIRNEIEITNKNNRMRLEVDEEKDIVFRAVPVAL